jgi:hypothetical protein
MKRLTVGQLKELLKDTPDHYRIAIDAYDPDVDVYGAYDYVSTDEDDVWVDDEYKQVELKFSISGIA